MGEVGGGKEGRDGGIGGKGLQKEYYTQKGNLGEEGGGPSEEKALCLPLLVCPLRLFLGFLCRTFLGGLFVEGPKVGCLPGSSDGGIRRKEDKKEDRKEGRKEDRKKRRKEGI